MENNYVPEIYVGENGNWYVNGYDTGTKAQGESGKDGITPHISDDGFWCIGDKKTSVRAKGYDGVTPHIGKDGFWYFEEINTGVKATGEKGDAGEVDISSIMDKVYPVGSIYMSVQSINPANLFGGTWKIWGPGRVPVCVDESKTEFEYVEKEDGSINHTLNVKELPVHTHGSKSLVGSMWNLPCQSTSVDYSANGICAVRKADEAHGYSTITKNTGVDGFTINATHEHASVGAGSAHYNLQPYITCYLWKRIA